MVYAMTSVAAKHARGKKLKDVIFVTAGQAAEDTKLNGRENVVNGTLGVSILKNCKRRIFKFI